MYFQCHRIASSETVDRLQAVSPRRFRHLNWYKMVEQPQPHFEVGDQAGDIWRRICEFSKRDLSFQSDALDAMMGLLQNYQESYGTFRHLWGLPVVASRCEYELPPFKTTPPELSQFSTTSALWTKLFSLVDPRVSAEGVIGRKAVCWKVALFRSLCWEVSVPCHRRGCFPRWSWTGWSGGSFSHNRHKTRYVAKQWWWKHSMSLELTSGYHVQEDELEMLFETSPGGLEVASVLIMTTFVVELQVGYLTSKRECVDEKLWNFPVTATSTEWTVSFECADVWESYPLQLTKAPAKGKDMADYEDGYEAVVLIGVSYQEQKTAAFMIVVEKKDNVFQRIGLSVVCPERLQASNGKVRTVRLG